MNRPANDHYRGKAPVNKEALEKHSKGPGIDLKRKTTTVKNKVIRTKLKKKEQAILKAAEASARNELLLTEEHGFLEAEAGETTTAYRQKQIVDNVDITSAAKRFKLDLQFGPYCFRYTRNGRHLLLGGKQGHVAAFDWVTKRMACEINVMESVHDVTWLHQETMFAVAQKDWVYVYDNQGVELHCLKRMNGVTRLEFLPYHFLLASGSKDGNVAWLDVSIGKLIARFNTNVGRISVMTQNPSNAVLCVGDSKGVVSMWSPNEHKPLAKMLCHRFPIMTCIVHPYGTYMATSCADKSVKLWDIRQLAGPVSHMFLRSPAFRMSYSQCGLLAFAMGNVVEVFRETSGDLKPYIRHKTARNVCCTRFCPYEDVLGISTANEFSSLLVPGSAEANYDAFEVNPFQNKQQRRETEVKTLLEKIQPEFITLDSTDITEVDVPTLKDKVEAKKNLSYIKPKPIDFKPRHTRAKGKGGTAKIIKTKKILKDLNHKEMIKELREVKAKEVKTKEEVTSKKSQNQNDYGVLNRFL
ncbi:WD repeat-containing protein 46 [Harpegnathos saltator]|uniref:WD repeat-containing protein 46 n=1 Tax=Harpegnathos saltator TaxID=610380 RepID=UPI0005902E05|nr:WD repeat-containing protein 46 [Harpegnathos saltator]